MNVAAISARLSLMQNPPVSRYVEVQKNTIRAGEDGGQEKQQYALELEQEQMPALLSQFRFFSSLHTNAL